MKLSELLNREEFQETKAELQSALKKKNWSSVAALIAGVIAEPMEEEDIWDAIFGEIDFTDKEVKEFETPRHAYNNRAFRFENGMTSPVTKVTKGKTVTEANYIATPIHQFDTKDLESGDLSTIDQIATDADKSLILEKNLQGIRLFTAGIVDHASGMRVVVKSETEDDLIFGTDRYKWMANVVNVLNRQIAEMQDLTGGGTIHMVCRSITHNDLKRANFDFGQVTLHTLNAAAVPGPDGLPTEEVLFLEGDILLIGPGAGNIGRVMDVEGSFKEPDHFVVEWQWRVGYKWIRWDHLGYNKKRIRRVMLIDQLPGDVTLNALTPTELHLRFSKPVNIASIADRVTPENSGIRVMESQDGGATWAQVATSIGVSVAGTLREGLLTFGVPLAGGAGRSYKVVATGDLKDVAEQIGAGKGASFNAREFGPYSLPTAV